MVKTPKTRHSKPQKEPVTIELEPGAVSRVAEPEKSAAESATIFDALAGTPDQTATQDQPDESKVADVGDSTNDQFFGSEWPPEQDAKPVEEPLSATAREETVSEPVANAFGRTPSQDNEEPMPHRPSTAAGASAPPVSTPPGRGRSGLVAGLLGGALALAGVGGLQFAGFWPGSGSQPVSNGEAVAALQADLAALKQELAGLKGTPGADTSALEQAIADGRAQVDGLAGELNALKTAFDQLKGDFQSGGADGAGAMESLDVRVAELEKLITSLGQGGGASPAELASLSGKIAAVEAAVRAANEIVATSDGRLGALEQSVAAMSKRIEALGDQPKVAMALAAAALKSALDRGGPFSAEVETFAVVAPDAPELAELRELAAKGVASRQEIVAGAPEAAKAMIAAGRVTNPDAGFFERLWSSAESLVSVRPIGAVEGPGVPETVARMEQAVNDGDFAKALAEYGSLPEAAKAAGADYAAKVGTRVAAETLVDKALAGALKAA